MKTETNYTNRQLFDIRTREFPEEIRRIAHQNPIVYKFIEAYAMGQILTREETLCQMVVALAKNGDSQRDKVIELMENFPFVPHPQT